MIGRKICEVIPYKNFKEKVRLIKSLESKKEKFTDLGNCLYIYYSTSRGVKKWNN